jgi:hypothetical protein
LPIANITGLSEFAFTACFRTSKETGEDIIEERTVFFFLHQARGQSFTQQVPLNTDSCYSAYRIHALAERNPQPGSTQGVNKTESEVTHE